MNKQASDTLWNQLIFIIIVVAFAALIMLFVVRFGSRAVLREEIYAKQIALAIDKAKPGTEIIMDISEVIKTAKDNKFKGDLIKIDNENNKVSVHLISGKGYSYTFFSDNEVAWNINENSNGGGKLILHIS